jgi:hypothetical protein
MKYPVKAGRGGCFGFVILPALTITKPKDSPSANQFEVATLGCADNSAFWTMPPKNITAVSKIPQIRALAFYSLFSFGLTCR